MTIIQKFGLRLNSALSRCAADSTASLDIVISHQAVLEVFDDLLHRHEVGGRIDYVDAEQDADGFEFAVLFPDVERA